MKDFVFDIKPNQSTTHNTAAAAAAASSRGGGYSVEQFCTSMCMLSLLFTR